MSAVTIAINLVANNGTGTAFSDLANSLSGAAAKITGLRSLLQGVTPEMGALAGATIASAAAFELFKTPVDVGITAASNLEQALVRLKFATQENASDMPLLTAAINDLAIQTMYGTDEAAGAFERLTEMGFNTQQILYGMSDGAAALMDGTYHATEALHGLGMESLYLGQALKADATDSANLLGAVLHTFANDGMSAADAANILAAAFFNGVPDVNLLAEAVRNGGSTAAAVGVKFQDFMQTLDLLSQAGLPASQAATSLNYYIAQLASPTAKAAKALADLGLITVNTGQNFQDFAGKLSASGAAGRAAVGSFDGTITSLQQMYKAGQSVGLISLDKSFDAWAIQAGIMSSKMFDAQGNFLGLQNSTEMLDTALGKVGNRQAELGYIRDIFNIRGGQDARLLSSLDDFGSKYDNLTDRFKKTDLSKLAADQLNTLAGSLDQLKDTTLSALATAFLPLLPVFTDLIQHTTDLASAFQSADPTIKIGIATFLLLGTVLTGATAGVLGLTLAVATLIALVGGTVLLVALVAFFSILLQIGVILALAVGWFLAFKTALDNSKEAQDYINQKLERLRQALDDLTPHWDSLLEKLTKLKPYWDALVDVGGKLAVLWGGGMIDGLTGFIDTLGWLFDRVGDGIDFFLAFQEASQNLSKAVGGFFQSLPGTVGDALDWIKTKLGEAKDWLVTKAQELANGIRQRIEDGFNAITGKVQDAVTTVEGWFSWLYDHNYYFQNLVDFIHQKWDEITAKFEEVKALAGTIWTVFLDLIQSKASDAWNWVVSRFDQAKTDMTGKVDDTRKQVVSIWDTLWSVVQSKFNDAKSSLLSTFDSLKSAVLDKANALKQTILDPIMSLGGDMFKWGQNSIQQLIDGITSKLGALKGKVGDAAGIFASLLGFHSPPPEGPAADSDTWMPNMLQMFTRGIEKAMPQLHAALYGTSSALSPVGNPGAFSAPQVNAVFHGGPTIVYLDGKEIARYQTDQLSKSMRRVGSPRWMR